MAAGDTDLGTGTTLAIAGMTMDLLSLSASGIERATVDVAHMGTSGAKPFLLGDQYDPGELTAEVHFAADGDIDTMMTTAAASMSIIFPETTAKTLVGAITSFSWDAPLEDVMTATVGMKVTSGSP